jgi:hypothetical protein
MRKTLVLTPLVALMPVLPAQGLERVYPESTLAFLQFAGGDALDDAGGRFGVGRLGAPIAAALRESGLFERHELREAVRELRQHLDEAGLDAQQVRELMRRPIAVGVGPLTMFGDDPDGMMPGLVFAIDGGPQADAVERFAAQMFETLRQHTPARIQLESFQRPIGDVTVHGVHSRVEPGSVGRARIGELVLAGFPFEFVADCVRVTTSGKGSLAGLDLLARERRRLSEDQPKLVEGFLHPGQILRAFAPLFPYEFAGIARGLGVGPVDAIWYGSQPGALLQAKVGAGAGSRDSLHIAMPLPEQGALREFFSAPHDGRFARYCGDSTLLYFGLHCANARGMRALGRFWDELPAYMRREIEHEAGREIERELRHAGMSLAELGEVIAAIGPEQAFSVSMTGLLPIVNVYAQVAEPAEAEQWLLQKLGTFGARLQTTEFEGCKLHAFAIDADGPPLRPAFTVHEGCIVASSDLRALKDALRQWQKGSGGLDQDPAFRALVAERPSLLAHARANRAVLSFWPTLESYLPFVLRSVGAPEELTDLMPTVEDAAAAIDDWAWTVTIDESGVLSRERGPFGVGPLLFGGYRLLDSLLERAAQAGPSPRGGAEPAKKKFF